MISTPLTPDTLQKAVQAVTLSLFKLDPTAFTSVRVGWQQQGQPAWKITDDVCILRAIEEDNQYNRVRDFAYMPSGWEGGNWGGNQGWGLVTTDLTELTTYTRVWRVFWTLYGPNSFDRARILRSALFSPVSHDPLSLLNLYLITNPASPKRVPELFEGQWWERVDFEARFNEAVSEIVTVSSVKSSEVIVENAGGVVADVTLTN